MQVSNREIRAQLINLARWKNGKPMYKTKALRILAARYWPGRVTKNFTQLTRQIKNNFNYLVEQEIIGYQPLKPIFLARGYYEY